MFKKYLNRIEAPNTSLRKLGWNCQKAARFTPMAFCPLGQNLERRKCHLKWRGVPRRKLTQKRLSCYSTLVKDKKRHFRTQPAVVVCVLMSCGHLAGSWLPTRADFHWPFASARATRVDQFRSAREKSAKTMTLCHHYFRIALSNVIFLYIIGKNAQKRSGE